MILNTLVYTVQDVGQVQEKREERKDGETVALSPDPIKLSDSSDALHVFTVDGDDFIRAG